MGLKIGDLVKYISKGREFRGYVKGFTSKDETEALLELYYPELDFGTPVYAQVECLEKI